MTPEQQNHLVFDILTFTMEDGTPISPEVKAETIIAELGLPDVPQLRRLIAIGAGRTQHRVQRRLDARARGDRRHTP